MSGKPRSYERTTYRIVVGALMAAIIFVVTAYIRVPIGQTKTNFANGISILAGLLFGGALGGVSAGVGSVISDILYGYGPFEMLITFVMKFLMAYTAGVIYNKAKSPKNTVARSIIASVAGALLYVALYMLKTYLFQLFVYGNTAQGALVVMWAKLPGSLLNAAAAIIVAPLLNAALKTPLEKTGILNKIK
ncbi:MAG: ECF transporter S component [Clostridia bacterium]|nr:ECF transporter S component [Clostridia bacterium]